VKHFLSPSHPMRHALHAFTSQLAVLALRSLSNLHVLDVSHSVITGDSLPRLCLALPRLKALSLAYNRLTEASLPTLNKLQELEYLDIREIGPISFTCIRNACKSPSLQRIRVSYVRPHGEFGCWSTARLSRVWLPQGFYLRVACCAHSACH
jgi:hypothetical protein